MDERYERSFPLSTLTPNGSGRGGAASALDRVAESLRRTAVALGVPASFVDAGPSRELDTRRIALLGQHSAKAALVNALFSREVVDLVHGAGRMQLIEWGAKPSLSWLDPEQGEGGEATWRELDTQPPYVCAQVRVDAAELRDPAAALIGLDLVTASLSNSENWSLLQSCQAVVMAVDATAQLTRTEVRLLREISRRAGPSLAAIAIIGVDDVAADERGDVVAAVRRHSAELIHAERVVVVDPDDRPTVARMLSLGAAGPPPSRLHTWARAISLILRAEQLHAIAGGRRVEVLEALEGRRTARVEARAREQAALDEWFEVRIRLRAEAARFSDDTAHRVRVAAEALARSLAQEFRASTDKVSWVRDSLADGVHAGLLSIAEECDREIGGQLARAVEAVSPLGLTCRPRGVELPTDPRLDELVREALAPLERRDRVRFYARFGATLFSTGGSVAAALYGVPLPSMDGLLAPLVDRATELSRRNEDDAVRSLRTAVHRVVARFADDAQTAMRRAHDDLLRDFGEEFRRQQELRAVSLDIDAGTTVTDLDGLLGTLEADIAQLRSLT